jgi:glycosyltransferase involved in cell wall biosynthesis
MTYVCYILSYHLPTYVRTRTLISALQKIDGLHLYQARNSSKKNWRYLETLWKLINIRISKKPDFYILGFRGYELFWPVRILTLGKPLIYDHLMSPYDSLLNERKLIRKGNLIEKLVFLYEKSILHNSYLVLTDTENHKKYFQELFEVSSQKILEIPVGTDEELFNIQHWQSMDKQTAFEVLFYGTFLPLHGIDVILDAASRLCDHPIHFTLIGGDKSNPYWQMISQSSLDNVTHIEWVEFEQLPRLISRSNIGLGGPFGNTGQAHRVVTGKTLQFLAKARPVIVGEMDPGFGFRDKVNCIMVPQGDGKALAEAIDWALHHKSEIEQIGWEGYKLYQDRYSIEKISEKIIRSLFSCNTTIPGSSSENTKYSD